MKYVMVYERGPENWGAFAPICPDMVRLPRAWTSCANWSAKGSRFTSKACGVPANPVPEPTVVVDAIETA